MDRFDAQLYRNHHCAAMDYFHVDKEASYVFSFFHFG